MVFAYRAFWLPKDIQEPGGYEDAFEIDETRGAAAICDGASSTLFAGRWSALLARGLVTDPPNLHDDQALQDWLRRYREAWSATIDENTLAWHQKPKLLEGAAATVLWIELDAFDPPSDPPSFRLHGHAVGDCCLFVVRGRQIVRTFPMQTSQQFEAHPQVLRSVNKRSAPVSFLPLEDQCVAGDLLVLCTDALAAWLMRQIETGQSVDWESHWNMTAADWQQWIVSLRESNQIRYDDSTLVMLRVGRTEVSESDDEEEEIDIRVPSNESLVDRTEDKMRGAWKSLKGSLRKGLDDLSKSKWLKDDAD